MLEYQLGKQFKIDIIYRAIVPPTLCVGGKANDIRI